MSEPAGTLFVLSAVGPSGAPSLRVARLALRAIAAPAAIRLRAIALHPSDLRRAGVREALISQGLDRLPALRPRSGPPVVGADAIADWLRLAAAPPPPAADAKDGDPVWTEPGGGQEPGETEADDAEHSEALDDYMRAQLGGPGAAGGDLEASLRGPLSD